MQLAAPQALVPARDNGRLAFDPFAREGMLLQEQFPGHDAQGEDVAGRPHRKAGDLLRGRVGRAAHEGPKLREGPVVTGRRGDRRVQGDLGGMVTRSRRDDRGEGGLFRKGPDLVRVRALGQLLSRRHEPGQAEVQDLHLAFPIHHDVAGLQVPVHDALGMGGLQGLGDGPQHLELGRKIQPRRGFGQGLAFDELHGDEGALAPLQPVVDLADVGVVELGQGHGLPAEAGQDGRVAHRAEPDGLEGHRALQDRVPDPVDRAHAPAAQEGLHLEASYPCARLQERHVGGRACEVLRMGTGGEGFHGFQEAKCLAYQRRRPRGGSPG